ncbi:hypothetical protein [Sphingomonas sp. PL20]|uniref:hypothetical protein n=1 Tax=Sphingomonas sp. PL20 TaxID=2760712 RepID=UPI001AE41CCB
MAPLIGCAVCLAALPPAILVLLDAWKTQEIVAVFDATSPTARGEILERYFDTPPAQLSSQAAAALAELAIEGASHTTENGLRKLYLGEAIDLVKRVRVARPDWPIGNILRARLLVAQSGTITPPAIQAFQASYANGGFLRREAKWRIAFATLCWRSLTSHTRSAVVDEAVWMVRYDGNLRPEIEALLGDSPAAVSFQLRLARPLSR